MQTNSANMLTDATSEQLANEITKILIEKQGIDVKKFDVRAAETITDFYINVTGKSLTHVSSLADDVVELIEARGRCASRVEGKRGNSWILIDYLDVIVNIFDRESRDFYNFERLLPSDSLVDISELVAEVDRKFDTN